MNDRKRFEQITGLDTIGPEWDYDAARKEFYHDLPGIMARMKWSRVPVQTLHDAYPTIFRKVQRAAEEDAEDER